MSGAFQNVWNSLAELSPELIKWLLEGIKSSLMVMWALLIAWLFSRRSAVARCWSLRMGVVALAAAALWQFAPDASASFRPAVTLSAEAPPTKESVENTPTLPPSNPREMVEAATAPRGPLATATDFANVHPEQLPVSPIALQTELRYSVGWLERNLHEIPWWGFLLVFGGLVIRQFIGLLWLRKSARQAPAHLASLATQVAKTLGIKRTPLCRIVSGLNSPLLTGWVRPKIWLPASALDLSDSHLRVIFHHELAHHRRRDLPWQALATIVTAFWWWNPLAWWLLKRLKVETELATDEFVASDRDSAVDYAEALVLFAGNLLPVQARPVGVSMAGFSSVEHRVKAILADHPFRNRVGGFAACVVILLGAGSLALAAVSSVVQAAVVADSPAASPKAIARRIIAAMEKRREDLHAFHARYDLIQVRKNPQPGSATTRCELWYDFTTGNYRNGRRSSHQDGYTRIYDGKSVYFYESYPADLSQVRKENGGPVMWMDFGLNSEKGALHDLEMFIDGYGEPNPGIASTFEERIEGGVHLMELVVTFFEKATGEPSQRTTYQWEKGKWAMLRSWKRQKFKQSDGTGSDWIMDWNLVETGTTASGIPYPRRYVESSQHPDLHSVSTTTVWQFEALDRLPDRILKVWGAQDEPFVESKTAIVPRENIHLRLVDSQSRQPLATASLRYTINGEEPVTLTTDDRGVVAVPLPRKEIHSLDVRGEKAGYVIQTAHWKKQGHALQLPRGYELELPPKERIFGKVVSSGNQPIAGAEVEVYLFPKTEREVAFRESHGLVHGKVKTNAHGVEPV